MHSSQSVSQSVWLWQTLNAYCKVFPTPPPSRRPIRVKQAREAAEKAAREAGQQEGAADPVTDKGGRQKLGVCSLAKC